VYEQKPYRYRHGTFEYLWQVTGSFSTNDRVHVPPFSEMKPSRSTLLMYAEDGKTSHGTIVLLLSDSIGFMLNF